MAYVPMSNGKGERLERSIQASIGSTNFCSPLEWDEALGQVVFGYCCRNAVLATLRLSSYTVRDDEWALKIQERQSINWI